MKVRYKITQEKDGLYKIEKWFGDDYDGEIDAAELNDILEYQLHGDQLVGKTQRMIERLINK